MTDSDSRPAGEAAIHRSGEQRHDVTQTFGHDSDLSFVPFGVELTDVEQTAIAALPAGIGASAGPFRRSRRERDTFSTPT